MNPSGNLCFSCVQGEHTPFKHLPECYYDNLKPLFELTVLLCHDVIIYSRN